MPRIRLPSTAVFLALFTIAAGVSSSFAESGSATIIGRIIFLGSIPPPQELKVNRDPDICGLTMTVQPLIVDGSSNGVKDAVVSIDGIIENTTLVDTPEIATLTNKECSFHPRIEAVAVGKTLELRNDDPMLHNTHIRRHKRTFVNVAQVVGGRVIAKLIRDSGPMSVTCDKHKFMQGYILAFDHPYFSVTDETGQFRIERVPPGRRKVTIWHETLGTVQTEITVPNRGDVSVSVEYPKE